MPATPIAYDPDRVEQRLAQQRRRVAGAAVGVLTPLLAAGLLHLLFFSGGSMPREATGSLWGFAGFVSALSLVLAIGHGLWYWRMTRLRVAPGLALQVSPLGIQTEHANIPWSALRRLVVVGSRTGEGHALRIEWGDDECVEIPLDAVEGRPAGVDSAVRAHSGGRWGVDLSAYGA